MLCTDLTLVGQDEGRLWAEPLHCGRWSCDVCNPLRRAAFIKLGILGQPNSFITLTDRRSPDRNKDQAAQGLVRARRSLWQQIDRTDRKIRAGAPVEGNRRGECKRYLYT
ncbi:MAG: hypothetical protein GWN84_14005, partial [Gammaproteobacteria bacterium]|nr:hypothetical protein [Gammaproteobacteria bacterium]NIR83918.1 hypothetical protein [Gammaproteobacteria bacterium]NIU05210.1 hypothetical protein [Gammaproteobacteria bacterium]NIX86483.1 hypothetical protein [Gammaproteobacteria bacterium]